MDSQWNHFTDNSNLSPFEFYNEPGPSQPRSHSPSQAAGDQNIGYSHNFFDQGDLQALLGGELGTGFAQPFHSDVPFQHTGHPLYTTAEGTSPSGHTAGAPFYHHFPLHPTATLDTRLSLQTANVNTAGLSDETVQGGGTGAQRPPVPIFPYMPPQLGTHTGYRGQEGTANQVSYPLQPAVAYDFLYRRPMGVSTDIQSAGSSSATGSTPQYSPVSPERVDNAYPYGHSMGGVVLPRNDPAPTFLTESGPSAPSFAPSRVAGNTQNIYGRGPLVPQEPYTAPKSHFNRHDPITFDIKDSNAQGIPIMDALQGQGRRLMGANDSIDDLDKSSISLRILWPGYQSWAKSFPTKTWTRLRRSLTRAALAKRVAEQIKKFYNEKCNDRVVDSNGQLWKIGSGGIQLDDLVLISLVHVSLGSWQPVLCLKNPRPSASLGPH